MNKLLYSIEIHCVILFYTTLSHTNAHTPIPFYYPETGLTTELSSSERIRRPIRQLVQPPPWNPWNRRSWWSSRWSFGQPRTSGGMKDGFRLARSRIHLRDCWQAIPMTANFDQLWKKLKYFKTDIVERSLYLFLKSGSIPICKIWNEVGSF